MDKLVCWKEGIIAIAIAIAYQSIANGMIFFIYFTAITTNHHHQQHHSFHSTEMTSCSCNTQYNARFAIGRSLNANALGPQNHLYVHRWLWRELLFSVRKQQTTNKLYVKTHNVYQSHLGHPSWKSARDATPSLICRPVKKTMYLSQHTIPYSLMAICCICRRRRRLSHLATVTGKQRSYTMAKLHEWVEVRLQTRSRRRLSLHFRATNYHLWSKSKKPSSFNN